MVHLHVPCKNPCAWQPANAGSSARLVPGATVGVLQPPSGVGSPERFWHLLSSGRVCGSVGGEADG